MGRYTGQHEALRHCFSGMKNPLATMALDILKEIPTAISLKMLPGFAAAR
jgi:hypothetical protein